MSGKMSRNKGKRGEREIVKLLQPILDEEYERVGLEPPRLQRNTLQSDSGGYDLVGIDNLAIEIKYQESYNLNSWWAQTCAQANDNQLPVLCYRKSRVAWRVRTFGLLCWHSRQAHVVVDISIEEFLNYFRMIVQEELSNG